LRVFNPPVPSLSKDCELVSSTNRSLTFRWTPAKSAIRYDIVGHSKFISTTKNTVTIHGLNPGSHYAFAVRADGSLGLVSNNIACVDSTGESRYHIISMNSKRASLDRRIHTHNLENTYLYLCLRFLSI